jgi:hypothetical protein
MLTFHAAGDWPREQIYLSCIPSTRLIIPEVEQLIADTWADIAARPGVHLFDGPMCRLESWLAAPDRLEIALSETSYKPEKIHPFAGALEPRDAMDLFAGVRRELAEELGFTSSDIADIRCTGVAEDLSIRQPELIFRVLSRRTRAQIEATVDRTEHHASWSIPATRAGIDAALEDAAAITPVGIAALLLWGRVRFGEDYFRDRSAVATPTAQLIQPAEGSGIKPPKPPRG